MPTTDLATDLHKQAEAATHGYATKSWLSRVVGDEGTADEGGFVKIHCRKGTDEILGATICSEHAGESISELTVAIQSHIGLGALGRTIHPYPTVAEAIQGCGIGYNRTQSGPGVELPSRISRRRRDCLLDGWNSVARAGGRRWKTTAARSSRSSWAR